MISYSLVFWWRGYELKTINFLDYLEGEVLDKQYNRNTGEVDVFGTIVQLMDRIMANMTRAFDDGWYGTWTYGLGVGVDITEAKQITVQNVKCWDALALVRTLFEYDYRIDYDSRIILVDYPPAVAGNIFEFGQGLGLCNITRLHSESTLVTRIYVYGSDRNIPPDYRTSQFQHGYAPRLMLPAATYPDGYIADAALEAIYGIREDFFIDESIYPSIVDGTVDEVLPIIDAALPEDTIPELPQKPILVRPTTTWYDDGGGGRVYRTDNAYQDDVTEIKYSLPNAIVSGNGTNYNEVTLFIVTELDINDENVKSQLAAKMSFTTGYLQGVELQINSWIREFFEGSETGRVRVVLQRNINDENYQLPNETVTIEAGDKFVLLDIFLPDINVTAAEVRLAASGNQKLTDLSTEPLAYSIIVPEEFVARSANVIQYLREGAALPILDTILGGVSPVEYLVQSVSADYKSEARLPTFNVSLSNKPLENRFGAMEAALKSATQNAGASNIRNEYTNNNNLKSAVTFKDSILLLLPSF